MAWKGGRMIKDEEKVLCILAVFGVISLGYLIYTNEDAQMPVPRDQKESQTLGLGVQGSFKVEAGSPLDADPCHHGWHPGYDPDSSAQPTIISKHRYPALPGGNMSTVMHKGWSSMIHDAPADNDWFQTPPEAATL
jgi:hypothetical protein